MILNDGHIRRRGIITPFHERTEFYGATFGLSPAGYDVRIAQTVVIKSGGFVLASTMERFEMPDDVIARVADKSSWARRGLAVQNTVIEPGWRGYLTLELTMHGFHRVTIPKGVGIAQIIFEQMIAPAENPYNGKYQDQEEGPQEAR